MEILNSQNANILGIQIENMDLEIIENRTTNGVTYIDLIGTPTKYYDNYHIKGIKYIKDEKEYIQSTYYLIEEAFYKEITKYEDWQNIDRESYENYRLVTDLDFTGKQSINYNLKIGNLVTEGKIHTIKNKTLNVGSTSRSGLISILKNNIENIKFENININCNQNIAVGGIGVIGRLEGNMHNIEFSNININISEEAKTIDQVGCIGYSGGLYIDKIRAKNVHITGGRNYIGGIFGLADYKEINDVEVNNINIESNANYVGGVIGRNAIIESNNNSTNIKITNSNIKGNSSVGSITGYGGFKEKGIVEDCVIEGYEYVGGALGNQVYACGMLKNTTIVNSHIKGVKSIGGIIGIGGHIGDSTIIGSTIEGLQTNSQNVGGVVGSIGWIPQQVGIKDSKVISKGINVGGIAGKGGQIYRSFANNVQVEGYAYVGGITGRYDYGNVDHVYTNATVIATEHSAGGIVGYFDNTKKDETDDHSFITVSNSYYAEGTIQAKENVGGLIGEIVEVLYGPGNYYGGNYVEAYLQSENTERTSLGIGNMQKKTQS